MVTWIHIQIILLSANLVSSWLSCGHHARCGPRVAWIMDWVDEKKDSYGVRSLIGFGELRSTLQSRFCAGYQLFETEFRDPFSCMGWQRRDCMKTMEEMGFNYTVQYEIIRAGKCLCKNHCNIANHFALEGEFYGITKKWLVESRCNSVIDGNPEILQAKPREKEALGKFIKCLSADDDCEAISKNLYSRQSIFCRSVFDSWCRRYALGGGESCLTMPELMSYEGDDEEKEEEEMQEVLEEPPEAQGQQPAASLIQSEASAENDGVSHGRRTLVRAM